LLRAIRYATHRMKAEVEMQKAQEEAETANRVKGELLAELQAAHAETELFLRSIPSILIGVDSCGRITHWNMSATSTFGIEDSSAVGRMIEDCGIRWLHPEIKAEIARWLATESAYRSENLAYERDGKTRFLGLNVLRVPAKGAEQTGFIITGADVTERMVLELQLRQAQKLEGMQRPEKAPGGNGIRTKATGSICASAGIDKLNQRVSIWMEPTSGLEPLTCRLRKDSVLRMLL
jgi:PAS domain S-box-containing protein